MLTADSDQRCRVSTGQCCGSARKLARGNWVMSRGQNSLITQPTPSGAPVFSLSFDDAKLFSYRADPVAFGRLRRSDLREADAQYRRATG